MRRILLPASLVFLLVEIAWLIWRFTVHPDGPPDPKSELSVGLGWAGLGSMIIMLIYSVARRNRRLRQFAALSAWLEFHIFFGLQGALLIFFHCWLVFFPEGGEVHVQPVALISLISVGVAFFSGIFGRYLYAALPRHIGGVAMGRRDADVSASELEKGIPAEVQALWQGSSWAEAEPKVRAMELDEETKARALRRIWLGKRERSIERAMRIFSRWIVAHRPTAAIMYILAVVHVIASGFKLLSAALLLAGLGLVAVTLIWSAVAAVAQIKAENKAREKYQVTLARGAQPPSLHPKIDLDKCVGTGACAAVCPEKDVIAVVDGKARVVNPTNCIGHGECRAACPVDAITLVIGSEKRGVDIPLIGGDFQTNVPGLYIAGELGGMGLIYNAVTQGLQALSNMLEDMPEAREGVHQLVIVGAGPSGLAASVGAIDAKLDFVTVDQEAPGGTILQYPRRKLVMTRPFELPIYGKVMLHEVSKESLLELWEAVMKQTGLEVRNRCKVESIQRSEDGVFTLETSQGPLQALRVLLTIGRRGSPRKLGVPGEDHKKVAYRLLEPDNYADARCLVVGGGDAAVEAAIALGGVGAPTHLSYRKDAFGRIKPKNQERLDAAVAAGQVTLVLKSNVKEVLEESVSIEVGGELQDLPNDFIFVFAGGILPTKFLQAAGVEVHTFKGDAFAPANI